jgi:hypothetical protein
MARLYARTGSLLGPVWMHASPTCAIDVLDARVRRAESVIYGLAFAQTDEIRDPR